MKKALLAAIAALNTFTAIAQIDIRVSEDGKTLYVNQNIKFTVGDKVKIGTGTSEGGDFKFIKINQLGFTAAMTATSSHGYNRDLYTLHSEYSGRYGTVKKIRQVGDRKHGYNYQLLLEVTGTGHRHQCEILNAITSGEIECDGCEKLRKNNNQVIVKNELSVADELAKLKKLRDENVLTEEEYVSQKNKILNK